MDNIAFVALVNSAHYVHEDLPGDIFIQLAEFDDPFEEFASSQQFHNEEEALGILVPLLEFDNVGVVHLFHDFEFSIQP